MQDENESRDALWAEIVELRRRVRELEDIGKESSAGGENRLALSYLDNAAMIIVIIDEDQRVRYINKKGCEILERPQEEIVGRNWFEEFVPSRIRDGVRHVFRKLIAEEIDPVEYFDNLIVTGSGEERLVAWHNTVLRNQEGRIEGTFSLGEDITQRRRQDEAKEDLIRRLRDQILEIKTMKVIIPVCALKKDNMRDAIREHYERISRDGRCLECLKAIG